MSVAIAIGGLLLLVAVHELGHFTAAKATGMRALRFYLGFPPAILKRRFGDTEYGIGAIPLGGFVKIPGMLRPEPGDLYEVDDLLDRSESLSEDEATAIGVALDDVRRNLTQGKYDDALAGLPGLRAAVDRADASLSDAERRRVTRSMDRLEENLDPRAYWRCSRARRLVVITAGPAANVLACFVILWGVAIHGRPDGTMLTHDVAAVIAGSPADHAGLKPGDRLVGINGRVLPPLQVRDAIERSHGNPITVTVDRHGHDVVLGPVRTKVIDGTLPARVQLPGGAQDVFVPRGAGRVGVVHVAADHGNRVGARERRHASGALAAPLDRRDRPVLGRRRRRRNRRST